MNLGFLPEPLLLKSGVFLCNVHFSTSHETDPMSMLTLPRCVDHLDKTRASIDQKLLPVGVFEGRIIDLITYHGKFYRGVDLTDLFR
jgi:hypothetical protein